MKYEIFVYITDDDGCFRGLTESNSDHIVSICVYRIQAS
jgi:hypothetical protein